MFSDKKTDSLFAFLCKYLDLPIAYPSEEQTQEFETFFVVSILTKKISLFSTYTKCLREKNKQGQTLAYILLRYLNNFHYLIAIIRAIPPDMWKLQYDDEYNYTPLHGLFDGYKDKYNEDELKHIIECVTNVFPTFNFENIKRKQHSSTKITDV